jgi:hypothetical protein
MTFDHDRAGGGTVGNPEKIRLFLPGGAPPGVAPATAWVTVDRIEGVDAPTAHAVAGPVRGRSVLFCAAPAVASGISHLIRLQRVARLLDVRPQVLLRGDGTTAIALRALGWTVLDATPFAILRLRPELALIDDSSPALVSRWVRLARTCDIPVARLHEFSKTTGRSHDDITMLPGWVPAATDVTHRSLDLHNDVDPFADDECRTLLAVAGGGWMRTLGARLSTHITLPQAAPATEMPIMWPWVAARNTGARAAIGA